MKLTEHRAALYIVAVLTLGAIALALILTNQADILEGLLTLIVGIIGGIAGYGARHQQES